MVAEWPEDAFRSKRAYGPSGGMPSLALMHLVRPRRLPSVEPELGSLTGHIRWLDLDRVELAPQHRQHPAPDGPPSLVAVAPLIRHTAANNGASPSLCHAPFTPR